MIAPRMRHVAYYDLDEVIDYYKHKTGKDLRNINGASDPKDMESITEFLEPFDTFTDVRQFQEWAPPEYSKVFEDFVEFYRNTFGVVIPLMRE
jgi:hypothetical protein